MSNFISMACQKECYEAVLESCTDDIIVKAGLEANTEYFWVITDRHGNLIQRKATTDADGVLTIDADAFLSQLNKYSGNVTLTIRKGDNYLDNVPMTFNGLQYNCVLFSFTEVDRLPDDDSELNVIQ